MTLTELLTYQIEKYTELLAIASTDPARAFAREEVWRLKRKKIELEEAGKIDLNELATIKVYHPDETVIITK